MPMDSGPLEAFPAAAMREERRRSAAYRTRVRVLENVILRLVVQAECLKRGIPAISLSQWSNHLKVDEVGHVSGVSEAVDLKVNK